MNTVGGQHRPYREPCDGSALCGLGPPFRHGKGSQKSVPHFSNNTSINGAPPIPLPAPLPWGSLPPPLCTGKYNWKTNGGGTCGPWSVDGDLPLNTFIAAGVKNFSLCRRMGFKTVQAKRQWHGRFAFNSPDARVVNLTSNLAENCSPSGGPCAYNLAQTFQATPDQIKYLTVRYVATNTYTIFAQPADPDDPIEFPATPEYDRIYTAHCNSSVDPLTGVVTASQDSNYPSGYICPVGGVNINGLIAEVMGLPADIVPAGDAVYTCSPNGWSVTSASLGLTVTATWDFSAGTFHQSWFAQAPGTSGESLGSITLSLSPTHFEFDTLDSVSCSGPPQDQTTTSLTGDLSDENLASAILADAIALLTNWPLNDDVLYPWRTDFLPGIAPLVTRWETPRNVSPDDRFTTDPNINYFDGSVRGAPLPGGYDRTFDFSRANYTSCPPGENGEQSPPDILSWGAWTPSYLPQNATQWTDDQVSVPPGAAIFYNTMPAGLIKDDCLWVVKWAETLLPWPSQNFARPGGADRFLFDETTPNGAQKVYQVVSVVGDGTGAVVTLSDVAGNPIGFSGVSGDIWGGASVNGFYLIASTTGSTVTLGTKVFNVPAGWSLPSNDTATAFGRLRWPTCPGILGRVAIDGIANTSPCQLTIDASPYLATNLVSPETIDICATDMTVLASNVAVTRVSDTEFTVPTAYATIAGAKWIVPHVLADGVTPGTHFYWNDDAPKRDYIYTDFTFNYRARAEANRVNAAITGCAAGCDCSGLGGLRTVPFSDYSAFTQTQGCLPFDPCNPSVVCISPNGETFTNGMTYEFPVGTVLDETYGTQWQAAPVQAVPDLLWQTPHHPPDAYNELLDTYSTFAWEQDDGTCKVDEVDDLGNPTVKFYAHPPMVEARCLLPANGGIGQNETAPALPTGLMLGFLSPVTNNSGDVAYAPSAGGEMAWTFYFDACNCIGNDGRFSGIYSTFMELCP